MTNTTCTELYNDMIENTYDLLCDICVIESLYRCRAQLPPLRHPACAQRGNLAHPMFP